MTQVYPSSLTVQRVYGKHRNILTTFKGRYNKHILFSNIADILQKKS